MRTEVNAVMLFIAELTGSFIAGSGTKEDKIRCGQKDYVDNALHELDLTTEGGRKELNENMWLERLYKELDGYFQIIGTKYDRFLSIDVSNYREVTYQWTVPIEMDSSASMLQYMGLLLNDKRLMEMTNIIGDTLQDPWKLKGMSRAMLKTAATPMLYASSQTCGDLWKNAKLEYTAEDVKLYTEEMASGPFGLANMFKDFIVNNCKPKATMDIVIGDSKFSVSCNRFRNVGEKTKAYKIWDSIDEHYNTVLHTDTKKVPDLDQFRRYMVTLLIHHLDSVVMDNICLKVMKKYNFCIPIHDAAIVSPAASADVREWYVEELESIRANRKKILQGFFKSIGITSAATEQWERVKDKVVPLEGELKASGMSLK
jgi:hypothetical protein